MILGSHNSWSYLSPKKWWMKIFKFVAKCQDVDIKTQYEKYGVRCFDLRIKFDDNGHLIIAHGLTEYDYSYKQLFDDLAWINNKKDCYVRILHEVRSEKNYKPLHAVYFANKCNFLSTIYPNIKFWCGRNLYNWKYDYNFAIEPTCEEKYSSVCLPKVWDDWYPRMYAKLNNHKNLTIGTNKDILLIDFVNYK